MLGAAELLVLRSEAVLGPPSWDGDSWPKSLTGFADLRASIASKALPKVGRAHELAAIDNAWASDLERRVLCRLGG